MSGNIIVPKSSAAPGRSADTASRMHTPQTGAMIADLGKVVLDVGVRLANEKLAREDRRLKLEMSRDLNNLRVEASRADSATDLDDAWASGVSLIRQSYFEGTDSRGRPRVDPRLAEDLKLFFNDLNVGHAATIGARVLSMSAAEETTGVADFGAELMSLYVEGDDDARNFAMAEFGKAVDANVARGLYAPKVAAEIKRDWYRRAEDDRRGLAETRFEEPQEPIDPADAVAGRLDTDPEAARLARVVGYAPDSAEAIARFSSELAALDEVPPAERAAWLQGRADEAGAKARAASARPMFAGPGAITQESLRTTAQAVVSAWRSGRISPDEYRRQARLIQDIAETFNG